MLPESLYQPDLPHLVISIIHKPSKARIQSLQRLINSLAYIDTDRLNVTVSLTLDITPEQEREMYPLLAELPMYLGDSKIAEQYLKVIRLTQALPPEISPVYKDEAFDVPPDMLAPQRTTVRIPLVVSAIDIHNPAMYPHLTHPPLGFVRNVSIYRPLTDPQGLPLPIDRNFAVLVLDDDHELTPKFASMLPELREAVMTTPKFGLLKIRTQNSRYPDLTKPKFVEEPVATTAGGVMLNFRTFDDLGGFGSDYFDTPELSLKMVKAGLRNYILNTEDYNLHHYHTKGGLKDTYPDKTSCNQYRHLSKIVERFSELVEPDDSAWLGFRFRL